MLYVGPLNQGQPAEVGEEVPQQHLGTHRQVRVALLSDDVVQHGPDDVFGWVLEFLPQPGGERSQSLRIRAVEQVEHGDHRAVYDIFTGVVVADVTNQVPDVAASGQHVVVGHQDESLNRPRDRDVDHLRIVHEGQPGPAAPGLVQDCGQDDHLLLPALEFVDGIGLGLVEHVGGLAGLVPVGRSDTDIGLGEVRAVRRDHFLIDDVDLALVRATSFTVLAHVVALDGTHYDHWPLGAAAGVRDELAFVELLVAEPDDDRVTPVVLMEQGAREAGAVYIGQRGQEIALAVVGGHRRYEPVRGLNRDRRQLPLVADHHH